jgi:hypothetical protein
METCDALISSVEVASKEFQSQAHKIGQSINQEVSDGISTLKARAARARSLAADRFAGNALGLAPTPGITIFDRDQIAPRGDAPGSGSQAPSLPNPTTNPDEESGGLHETDIGDGLGKEGDADPEGAEGPSRNDQPARPELNPPPEWRPGVDRR